MANSIRNFFTNIAAPKLVAGDMLVKKFQDVFTPITPRSSPALVSQHPPLQELTQQTMLQGNISDRGQYEIWQKITTLTPGMTPSKLLLVTSSNPCPLLPPRGP